MTYALGPLKFVATDRLYESMRILCTLTACITFTAMAIGSGRVSPKRVAIFRSKPFKLDLHIPGAGPMELSIQNKKPDWIELKLTSASALPLPDDANEPQHTLIPIAVSVMSMIFSDFYEMHREWIESPAGYGANAESWPPLINFCRVVRNAIAHSGRIHFKNPRAASVHWHSFQYAPSDEGRLVLATDLHYPEIFLLMLDLSRELDRVGAPLTR